jgi:hypothetical protein
VTPRQAYALAHPIGRADGSALTMRPYLASRRHPTGVILKSILAVDR